MIEAEPPKLRKSSAALFVVIAGAAFSVSGPLARYARPTHPLVIAFGRVALAAIVLLAIDRRAIGGAVRGLSPRNRLITVGAGALLAAHFALFLWGLDTTSLPAAVSLVSLEPLSVVLCAWGLLGLRPTRREQVGVVLATAGAAIIAQGAGHGDHRMLGDTLVLGAVALYGLYLTLARLLRNALPARSYAAMVYASGAVFLGLGVVAVPAARESLSLPVHSAVAIALLALVPTLVGHTAVQTASRVLSPSIVALVSPGETLGGIAIGALFLGAVPSGLELSGALVILTGAAMAIFTVGS